VVSAVQSISLIVSLALLLALVPRFGAWGAAAALLGAGIVRWVLLLGGVRVILKLPLPRLYLNAEDWRFVRSSLHP
jgi:O-antigen/teichoic acid export membrane protein